MNFHAYVKAIKADVGKKEITLSFVMKLDDENMEQAQGLAFFANADAPAVELEVQPLQKAMVSLIEKNKGRKKQ